MLHILWLILKFLLILIGSILGLVLLIILLVLFCPFRYEAAVAKQTDQWKEISGGGSVSWLMRIIRVSISYAEGKLDKEIYLFGIPLLKTLARLKEKKRQKQQKKIEKSKEKTEAKPEEISAAEPIAIEQKPTEPIQVDENPVTEKAEEDSSSEKKTETIEAKPLSEDTVKAPESSEQEKIPEKTGKKRLKLKKPKKKKEQAEQTGSDAEPIVKPTLEERIQKLLDKVKAKMQKLSEKKQKIEKQINWWKSFLGHPKFKAAFQLLIRSLVRILKHVLPTKMDGDVTFSFEDPARTGQILAILGMTIPFHKNSIEIHPLFDGTNQVTGHVRLKGRIYLIVMAYTGIRILIDKNIRFVIRYWKKRRKN